MKLHEIQEQRSQAVTAMRALADKVEAESRDYSAEEEKRHADLKAEITSLDVKLQRARDIADAERAVPAVTKGDDKLDKELRSRFSVTRAIAAAAGLDVDAGFEREMQSELARRAGRPAKGIFIPTEVFETRVLTTTAGAELVPTDHRPDQYISALTAASVVRGLGARVLSGLTGNLSIPRETDSPAIGWVAENAALSSDDADFDAVTLSPKHAGALSEWSRNMLLQSSPDVERLLRQMLARNLALAIDRAAIRGGGSNEPVGVLETTGIQKVTAPASIFEGIAEAVAKADAENVGASRAILTTPEIRKTAALAMDITNRPIGVSTVFHNLPTTFSNQVPKILGGTPGTEHGLIYGDWSELLIGIWSEIDILVNPYESTAYSKGNVSIRAMATVDCAVRQPKAFVSIEDVTTSTIAMPVPAPIATEEVAA